LFDALPIHYLVGMTGEDSDQALSSSDDLGGSTPCSSVHSDIDNLEKPERHETSLPSPFLPPSLSHQELPRELPDVFGTPQVPLERAHSQINAQDMYALRVLL
jgi:hypothetical protein